MGEREKKVKGDVEKAKRKVEGDLKLTHEAVSDLERVKAELSGGVARKEKEGSALSAKIDDEATLASKYAKQAKELMARLEELDEELNIERGSRAKAEKSRTMLKKDIEDIGSHLEELKIAQEGTLAALRMKHNNTMSDLGEQIDSLNGNKVKSEKDKAGLELDLRDARLDLEDAVKGKAELDKTGKLLQGSIVDSNTRLDEMARALNEAESTKKRLQVENQDLNRQIEELEAAIANMNKGKISVTTQLEDSKALADAEAKDRAALLTKYKMMSSRLCPSPRLRSSSGSPASRPRVWAALRSLRV